MIPKKLILFLCVLSFSLSAFSQEYAFKENISYIPSSENDVYRKERCKLDIYYPVGKKNFPVVVWFHGGGLEGGDKFVPKELKNQGIAVVAVNYRLSPKASHPAYIEDAAESVAWAFKHIAEFGGSVEDIYVAGHSAGGYLALMVGLDKSYLNKYGVDADKVKAYFPISGQTNTHYTIKKEMGLSMDVPYIDQYAPLAKVRKDIPPMLLTTGQRTKEMTARYEENAHLYAVLKAMGNTSVVFYELEGFDHGSVCVPSYHLMLEWIKKYSKE